MATPTNKVEWLPGLLGPLFLRLFGVPTPTLRTKVNLEIPGLTVTDDTANGQTTVAIPDGAFDVAALTPGTNGQVLKTTAGVVSWGSGGGGSVPTGTGFYTVTSDVADATAKPAAAGIYTWLETPSSANLAAALTDETGTGEVVFSTTPTLKTSFKLNNPGNTYAYTFTPAAIAANRTITLPLLAGNDTMVTEAFSQSLTNKTIDAASNMLSNIANAAIATAAAIDGTKISPNFGSQNVVTTGYYSTGGTVASAGNMRLANTHKVCARNAANSADVCMMQYSSGDYLFIGLNSSFTEQAYIIVQAASNAQYFGIGSSYYWVVEAAQLSAASPIVGYSSPYSVHGQVSSAHGDANYTVPASEYKYETIKFGFLCTAGRTMTFPAPASDAAAYHKEIINTTTQTLTITTGSGGTKTLASGLGQWFRFTSSEGVKAASATYTP